MPRKRTGYDAACYYDGKLLGRCTKADSDAYTLLMNACGGDAARVLREYAYFSPELKAILEKAALMQADRSRTGGMFHAPKSSPWGEVQSCETLCDMYPQFWTPRIGGIFMKYSYEYKKNCIELYRQGKWPETPDGIKQENFRISVRRWSRREKSCGAESLQKNQKKMWSADEKYELIAKVLAGVSITESAISAGVEPSLLSQWVRCYKMKGYQGLAAQRKGRPPKEPDDMKKKIVPAELTPSEREELIRLRAENEYLRTENEVIKKRIALRQEKFAAQLKAKKLHSSTNSEEKDTL